MDFIITIGLLYLAYRGYQWYQRLQGEVRGDGKIREVREDELFDAAPPPATREDDYIDYEEIKSEERKRRE